LIQINISTLKIGRKGQQHILGNTIAKQTTEQMTGRTQEAITSYFAWLQNAMLAPPWGDTDLNKKLISYATETVTAPCAFAQKLTQAKNLEDVIKIQTNSSRRKQISHQPWDHADRRAERSAAGHRPGFRMSRNDHGF